MANHSSSKTNCTLQFVDFFRRGRGRDIYPRVPVLRASRDIEAGEELLYNYHTNLAIACEQGMAESADAEMLLGTTQDKTNKDTKLPAPKDCRLLGLRPGPSLIHAAGFGLFNGPSRLDSCTIIGII